MVLQAQTCHELVQYLSSDCGFLDVNMLHTPGGRAHIKVNKVGICCSLEQHHWSIEGCGVCDLTLHGSCQIQPFGQLPLLQI